jgi:p-hydroxybenzoate 3-monooxygenase
MPVGRGAGIAIVRRRRELGGLSGTVVGGECSGGAVARFAVAVAVVLVVAGRFEPPEPQPAIATSANATPVIRIGAPTIETIIIPPGVGPGAGQPTARARCGGRLSRNVRTQVGIVGAGPAGLTLSLLLERAGIESVILEDRSRDHVERRVRAGLLEQNTVDLLHELGVGGRLGREGLTHEGIKLRRPGSTQRIAITELTGRHVTIYGQQEIVKDLVAARLAGGGDGRLLFEVSDVTPHDLDSEHPRLQFSARGERAQLECDFIAGCDGFHGVCRASIPAGVLTEHDYVYPFAWLGILAEAPPATDELIYAWHDHGFCLHSMRSDQISRLYLQVPADEDIAAWPDDRIWEELQTRLASEGWQVSEGPVIEKGITPMRSYVCEPLRHERLFLAGDAAHIVPPTGAKGLNLAVNDVRLLAAALVEWYERGSPDGLERYSETALRRVWRAQDFSNYMTQLLHDLGGGTFERELQLARLDYLARSAAAATSLAENYAGLPATPDF